MWLIIKNFLVVSSKQIIRVLTEAVCFKNFIVNIFLATKIDISVIDIKVKEITLFKCFFVK